MSLIIIGKVAVGSFGAAAVGVSGWWFYGWMNRIEGFLSVSDSNLDESNKKFQCQVGSGDIFDCNIEESSDATSSVNNQIKLIDFSTRKTPTKTLKTGKLYKIKISKTDFETFKTIWTDKKTSIPILVWKKDDTTVSLGSIYAGFDTDDGTKKIEYFVGQASKDISITNDHKCSWITETVSDSDLKTCKIFPFVSVDLNATTEQETKISSLTFVPTKITATAIKTHHYHLIKFTTPTTDSKKLTEFTNKDIVYLKKTSDSEKVTFSKLSAVLPHKNKIFILKSNS